MYSAAFRRHGHRRAAVLLTTTALLGAVVPAAHAEDAQDDQGTAGAAVLRTGLDVGLLNDTVQLPLSVALNEVTAPAAEGGAEKTALTATLEGVDQGRPFEVLRADVAAARATADTDGARAEAELVDAAVHVPGLPLLSVIEVESVQAHVVCETGAAPSAEAQIGPAVTILGQEVDVTAGGTTEVAVPGVGEVTLDLSRHETTADSAAAAALELIVSINPLNLGVATVDGRITLAEASCQTPAGGQREAAEPGDEDSGAEDRPATQTVPGDTPATGEAPEAADQELAATGGGSGTVYVVGGAAALLGIGAVLLMFRRRAGLGRS